MLNPSCRSEAAQPSCGTGRALDAAARKPGIFLLFVFILLSPLQAFAQSQPESKSTVISSSFDIVDTAPVVINGEVRFHVVGIKAYPAKRRARDIARRIEALAEDPQFDPKTLHVVDTGPYHAIFSAKGGKPVLRISDPDADLEGVRRSVLAEALLKNVTDAIKDYRHDHQPDVLLKKALFALGSIVMLVALLYGVFWGFRRLNGFLEPRVARQMQDLETRTRYVFRGRHFWGLLSSSLRMLQTLVVLVLIYLFTNFALSLFPQTRYVAHTMFNFVLAPLQNMGTAVINFIPALVFLVVLFFITRYVLKFSRSMFSAIDRGRVVINRFEPEWAWPTYRIVRVLIIIFALVIAYPFIPGSETAAFKGITVLVGVLFSLGSSSVISNLIAGYTMTYRRAFRIGDRVKIGDTVGDVTEMRVLVTHIKTPKNEEVVIPNSSILNGEVTNYSTMAREQGLILHTTVGIGYEVPWRQVEAMLLLAAERTDGLLKEPKPFIRQESLAEFSVNYELNAYCNDASRMLELYTEMHRNIQDVFNENGVQIMTPAYETDPAEPKIVPKEKWYNSPVDEPK